MQPCSFASWFCQSCLFFNLVYFFSGPFWKGLRSSPRLWCRPPSAPLTRGRGLCGKTLDHISMNPSVLSNIPATPKSSRIGDWSQIYIYSLLSGVPDVPHAVNDVSLLAEGNSVGESSLPSVIVSICDDRDNTFKTTNEVSFYRPRREGRGRELRMCWEH